MAEEYQISADVLGQTGGERVEIAIDGRPAVSASVEELQDAYEGALEKALRTEPSVEERIANG